MSAPEGKNIYLELSRVCLAHSLLQNEKQKLERTIFVKHFNGKLEHKESRLYIGVPAKAKFTGAVAWQPPRATEVRRRELQAPLILVANCFSLAKRGQRQCFSRSTAPVVLAASRVNSCGNLTKGCFFIYIFTYDHYVFLNFLKYCLLQSFCCRCV